MSERPRVTVEFFGTARQRSGCARMEVAADTLAEGAGGGGAGLSGFARRGAAGRGVGQGVFAIGEWRTVRARGGAALAGGRRGVAAGGRRGGVNVDR